MTAHQDRVRAVLCVHELEADRRFASSEPGDTLFDLTDRVARVQHRLGELRSRAVGGRTRRRRGDVDTGDAADEWMLAVYDAALIQLCDAVGVAHSLADEAVCPASERQRVELELLSSVLPLR